MSRADSTRSRSIAFAGDSPVSSLNSSAELPRAQKGGVRQGINRQRSAHMFFCVGEGGVRYGILQQLRTPTAKRLLLPSLCWLANHSSGEHNRGLRNSLYGASSFASPSSSVAFLEHSDRAVIGSHKQNFALRLWSDRKYLWPNGSGHAAFDTDFRSAEKARAARHA
jgi:hypothetical protein